MSACAPPARLRQQRVYHSVSATTLQREIRTGNCARKTSASGAGANLARGPVSDFRHGARRCFGSPFVRSALLFRAAAALARRPTPAAAASTCPAPVDAAAVAARPSGCRTFQFQFVTGGRRTPIAPSCVRRRRSVAAAAAHQPAFLLVVCGAFCVSGLLTGAAAAAGAGRTNEGRRKEPQAPSAGNSCCCVSRTAASLPSCAAVAASVAAASG